MNSNQTAQNFGQGNSGRPQGTSPSTSQSTMNRATEGASETAGRVKEKVADATSGVTSAAKEQVSKATHDVTQAFFEATEKAKNTGRDYATRKKSQAVAELDVFRDAILRAADKLKEENHEAVGCYVAAAAEQVGRLRESLQNRNVQSLLQDAKQLTRRHPEVVYGGLFVAGVALMRFLKASHHDDASSLAARRDIMYSSARGRNAAGPRTTNRGVHRQGEQATGASGQGGPIAVNSGTKSGNSASVANAASPKQTPEIPLTSSSSYQTGKALDPSKGEASDARIIPSIPLSDESRLKNTSSTSTGLGYTGRATSHTPQNPRP